MERNGSEVNGTDLPSVDAVLKVVNVDNALVSIWVDVDLIADEEMNEDDIKNADDLVGVDSNGAFFVSVVIVVEVTVVDVNDIMETIFGVDLIVFSFVSVVIVEDIVDINDVADDVASL